MHRRDALGLDHALHERDHRLSYPETGNENGDSRRIWHKELRGNAAYGRLERHELAVAERRVPWQDDRLSRDSAADSAVVARDVARESVNATRFGGAALVEEWVAVLEKGADVERNLDLYFAE